MQDFVKGKTSIFLCEPKTLLTLHTIDTERQLCEEIETERYT